jgi:hypothetical protein
VAQQGLTRPAGPGALPALFDDLEETAERAAAAVGGFEDAYFRIAGMVARLRFAGPALVPRLAPSLAHLRTGVVDDPDLTVRLFDSSSTDTAVPPMPWSEDAYRDDGRVHARLEGELVGVFEPGTFSVWRPAAKRALYWIDAPGDVHYSETGSPLIRILNLWLRSRGFQIAHAAAVGDPDGCALIVGTGGVGKSSTTLACLPSELRLLGDDYCVLGPGDPPLVHTLYSAAKTHADTLARLPFLAAMVANPDRPATDKALCFLNDHVPDRLMKSAPLRAVAVPRVTGRADTTTAPAPPSAALAALAPSTLFQLAGADTSTFSRLSRAVRSVSCHYLDLGTDPAQIPAAIRSLLRP